MSFLDAAHVASAATNSLSTSSSNSSNNNSSAPELSLEDALAFFDGFDDAHAQQHTQQQHAMGADVLMMMDDGPASTVTVDDFAMGGASFLYNSGIGAHAVSMSDAGADFGLMLQPLQLDDPALLVPPTLTQETPMQTLLAAPLTQSQPALSATRSQSRSGSGRAQAQRASSATTSSCVSKAGKATAKSISTAPAGGSAATKPPTNSSSTKRVRRQKEELLYLRTKVVELEERLQQLKRVNGETSSTRGSPAPSSSDETGSSPVRYPLSSSTTQSSSSSSSSPSTQLNGKKRRGESSSETEEGSPTTTSSSAISPALLASVWENVAERQYKERLRAEQQNKKLKTMLESQIKLATSLEKILKKRPNMEVLYPDTEPPSLKPQRVFAYEETDADVFKKQADSIMKAYPRAAEVMAATGFFTSEETQHDFRVKDFPDEDGVLMEFMAQSAVPFDLEITGNALWRFMADVSIKKHCYFEEVVSRTDTAVSRSFGVRACEDGKDFDMRGKHSLRKFVEEDRVVVVSTSLVDPIKLGNANVRGLRLDDVAWIVVQRSESNPSGLSLIRAYVHIRPLFPEDSEDDQDDQIGALTDFVINAHESNSALCIQLINDLLVEEEWKTALLPVVL